MSEDGWDAVYEIREEEADSWRSCDAVGGEGIVQLLYAHLVSVVVRSFLAPTVGPRQHHDHEEDRDGEGHPSPLWDFLEQR